MTTVNGRQVNSQGASEEHMSDGQGKESGIVLPPIVNAPPVTEVTTQAKDDAAKVKAAKEAEALAVQNPAPATTEVAPPAGAVADWPAFQDQALSSASNILKEAGLSYTEATAIFSKAFQSDNLNDVDMAALETKLGKDKAVLAMAGVKDYYNRQKIEVDKTVTDVHAVVGGKDSYEKIKAWAKELEKTDAAFAADLVKYREMFDAGGVSARAAALDLARRYKASPNTSGLETRMVEADKGVQPQNEIVPITRSEYNKLLKEAHKKGDRILIKKLDEQRRAGIKAKI